MKSMATKYNKRIMVLLLTVMILFQSFYYNYKESEAMELGMTIAIEEALLYLAGLCGITLAGGAIADLSPAQRRQIKDAFDEGCQQANISQQEQIAWEQKLCEGVLDKTSECWKAFLDSISTSRDTTQNKYVGASGISCMGFLDSFHRNVVTSKGYVLDIDMSGFNIPYLKNKTTSVVTYYLDVGGKSAYLSIEFMRDSVIYPIDKYPEFWDDGTHIRADSDLPDGYVVNFSFEYNETTGNTARRLISNGACSGVSTASRSIIADRPVRNSRTSDEYKELEGNVSVPTFNAYSHWSDIGAFNGDRTLSDVYNLINSNAVSDTGVVNIPWENVAEIPIPMPGDKTEDTTATISGKMEKLWEQLAAGEITWEQFITLLQNAVGVVTLEGVIADDVPIEGDQPIVIEQELVPDNPSDPKEKEEIIEQNISNTAYVFDIKEFFPFCIPFDLYNIISYLNAEPEAPKFDIPIPSYDRSGNLTMANKITVDLSMFDSVALVFRVCIFIIFIIGLIIITRNLIRG